MPNKYEPLIIGLAMITMGSTLTALLRPQTNLWQTLRNWIAGIVGGVLVLVFCYKNEYKGVVPDLSMIVVATFVQAVYPIAEKFTKLYLEKRMEEKTGKKAASDTNMISKI